VVDITARPDLFSDARAGALRRHLSDWNAFGLDPVSSAWPEGAGRPSSISSAGAKAMSRSTRIVFVPDWRNTAG